MEEDGGSCVEPGRREAMLKGQKLFFSVFTNTATLVEEELGPG